MKNKIIPSLAAVGLCAVLSCTAADPAITKQSVSHEIQTVLATDTAAAFSEATYETATFKINGSYLNSPYAPIVIGGTTIVPLRAVMETLGWNVEWIDETQSINITNGEKTIGLQIGSCEMKLGGDTVQLATAPSLIGEVTYIPIRAVSEALGATVGWDGETNTASIYTGNHSSTLTIGQYRVKAGSTVYELTSVCGEPTYKMVGEKGLTWYIYAEYPSAFMAVATDGGLVCGYYTSSTLFSTSEGYIYGSAITEENAREFKLIDEDGYTLGLYYDKKDGILCGVQYMLDGFSSYHDTEKVLNNQARLGLDILNSFRYAHGKYALSWNEYAAASSAEHAYYMAFNGELTHNGADGSSAIDRYLRYNPAAEWRAWGESICAGTDSIFHCINGWINSDYNRSIILSDKTHAGIGFINLPTGKYKYSTVMFLIK